MMDNEDSRFAPESVQKARELRRAGSSFEELEEEIPEKRNYISKLIFIQSMICLSVILILFSLQKINMKMFTEIKTYYDSIMSVDMTAKQVMMAIKDMSGFVLKPSDRWLAGQTKTTENESENSSENESVSSSNSKSAEKNSDENKSEKTEESMSEKSTKAVTETETVGGSGGEDIPLHSAAANSSLAPYFLTVKAVTPVMGRITSNFGYRIHPITKAEGFHSGLDIGANEGDRISAAFYGKVKETGYNDAVGNYIILEHQNGLETMYGHCSQILADKDAIIRSGETIALVGSTGISTGPHLHLEIRINGIKMDPGKVIKL